ncbi:hypothetical protein [Propioniciclava flava]
MLVFFIGDYLVTAYGANGASFALVLGQGAQLLVTLIGFLVSLRSLRPAPSAQR